MPGAKNFVKFLAELWADERAIASVEYALLLAFAASGIIFAAESLGNAVGNQMNEVAACFDAESTANGGSGGGTGDGGGSGGGDGNGGSSGEGFALC